MSSGSVTVERIGNRPIVRVLQRICSFPVMLASLFATLAVLTVRSRFDDPDMWWHLKMGEIIWTTHVIPRQDIFSYTTAHHSYVPHEWLSQLVIYSAYRFAGYSGMMLLLCIFASVLLIAGYGLCWLYSENAKVAFLGGITIWLFSTIGLAIRPHMIGYLFVIVELSLLHLGRTRDSRFFFGLPALFAIWVNAHGSFSLGLIIAGVTLFSSFFHFRAGLLISQRWEPIRRRVLAWAVVLSIAALFLNPVGVRQILYPVDTLLHQPVGLSQVLEWQPLRFDDPRAFALLGMLGCCLLLVIARQKYLLWHEVLMLAIGAWLAASHQRMLFVFGILVAPVLSRLLASEWEGYDIEQDRPVPNVVVISASLLTILWAFPSPKMLAAQVDVQSPVKAVEFLKSNRISGRMLNEYVYGGYLIWAAPEYPVFVDGRADVFEATGVLGDLSNWATLQSNPAELLNKYNIDFCLLSRQSPMIQILPLLHWTTLYSDNNSIIFARNAGGAVK